MIDYCKVCNEKIPIPKLGGDYWCFHCQKYSIVFLDNGIIESEMLTVNNYRLCFFPIYKKAAVVEGDLEKYRVLVQFDLQELNTEIANHWISKLKKYVVFQ